MDDWEMSKFARFTFYLWTDLGLFCLKLMYLQSLTCWNVAKLKGNLGDDRKMSKFGQFAFYFWTDFWLFSLKIRYLQLKSGKLKANFGGWSKNVKIWNIYLVFLAKFRNLLLKPFLIEILKSCCPCGARCFVYLQSQLTQ